MRRLGDGTEQSSGAQRGDLGLHARHRPCRRGIVIDRSIIVRFCCVDWATFFLLSRVRTAAGAAEGPDRRAALRRACRPLLRISGQNLLRCARFVRFGS